MNRMKGILKPSIAASVLVVVTIIATYISVNNDTITLNFGMAVIAFIAIAFLLYDYIWTN